MGGARPSLRRGRQAGPTGRLRVTSGPQDDLYPALADRPRSAAIGGAALLAFSGIFFRFSGVSPSTASVFRCAYALPLLFVLARYEDRHAGGRDRRSRALALAAGVFFACDLLLWMHAVDQVGAGLGTVLANLQVVIVALAGWLLLGERPSRRTLAAIPFLVAGSALISGLFERGAYGADPALGVVFGLGSAVAYSGYLLLIRRGNRDRRVFGPLFDASIACALTALVVGLVVGDLDLAPSWPAHGWLLVVALTSQVAGYGLVNVALPRLPAALTSILLLAQPVMTVVVAAIVLAEAPSLLQLLGVGFILGSLAFATAPVGRMRDAASARREAWRVDRPTIGGE
jgi:drug/metabolite transporter (DMT)-like permease